MLTLGFPKALLFPRQRYMLRIHAYRFSAMADCTSQFDIIDRDGSARTGVIRHVHGQLQTPALLLYTRRGSPLHLTPDMVQHLGPTGQNTLVDVTKL